MGRGTRGHKEKRLEKSHFREILAFAGPSSKYNFIKSKSASQNRNLWRNTVKSKDYYRGHIETGFETEFGVHDSASQFCPFNHCQTGIISPISALDMDIVHLTPKSISKKCVSPKAQMRRKLFKETSNKEITSPTKEELKLQTDKLISENQKLRKKLGLPDKVSGQIKKFSLKPIEIKCKISNCKKIFLTCFGLKNHQANQHSKEKMVPLQVPCEVCGKVVANIDKHLSAVHRNILSRTCEVCKQSVPGDMKKHRGFCNKCLVCGKVEKNKKRLLKHIEACVSNQSSSEQNIPLDLSFSSPMKIIDNNKNPTDQSNSNKHDQIEEMDNTEHSQVGETNNKEDEGVEVGDKDEDPGKRSKYPFDIGDEDFYVSEYEEDDSIEYTTNRRQNKDNLEINLREIDDIEDNENSTGDKEVLRRFREFMQTISNSASSTGEFSYLQEASTVRTYTRAIERDVLRALHELFQPFDSLWLLDCETPKLCKFEGEERKFVKPEEPIYLTSRVLRKALEKYETGDMGQQKAHVLAATVQFMNFIELHLNNKLNLYGRDPIEKIMTYHCSLKSYMKATKTWKTCNQEKKKTIQINKDLKEIKDPNFEAKILEKLQKYIKSSERLSKIKRILESSKENAPIPSGKVMTEFGNIVMGEIVVLTGTRPVALYRLLNGAYVSKKPGFNENSQGDEENIREDNPSETNNYRRLNPNLPPKHLACTHQLENETAICPEQCNERCDPDGYNILVDWDKTSGSGFLHIPKPIKDLMDLYDLIKSKFFKGRKPKKSLNDDWLEDLKTPFFLKSSGSPFQQLDLSHLSEVMGIDVKSYDYRRIVSTWAQSHRLEIIRKSETEALQHSSKIAHDDYLQNKQLKPQILTQTYLQEEFLLPKKIKDAIKETEQQVKSTVLETEVKRKKKQNENLLKDYEAKKVSQKENRPLGSKHRILEADQTNLGILLKQKQEKN